MSVLVVLLWAIVALNLVRIVKFVGTVAGTHRPVQGAGAAVLLVLAETLVVALAALALTR